MAGGDLLRAPRRASAAGAAAAGRASAPARPARPAALKSALRSAIESFILSVADRAAEEVDGSWRDHPAGAVLLDDAAAERARESTPAVFESALRTPG